MASGVGPGEHGESSGIWVINVLAATPRQILGNAEGAVPSPDGKLIAFRSSLAPDIGLVDANGENYRKLATAALNETFGQLQWSPDGKKLGVLVRRIGNPEGTIEAIDIGTGERAPLGKVVRPRSFVWLANGAFIVSSVEADGSTTPALHEIDAKGQESEISIGPGNSVAQMSATSDGKQLVLVREKEQSDAYVGTVEASGKAGEMKRLTLDDRDDLPSAWLPDGKTILFSSNRNGNFDVFREATDSPTAEQLAAGGEQQTGAEPASDGRVLYWSWREGGEKMRLMSMPAAGGPPDVVLEAPQGSSFHCASGAAKCVLAVVNGGKVELAGFDWHSGKREAAVATTVAASATVPPWALAADAGEAAFAGAEGLEVVRLSDGQTNLAMAAADFPGKLAGVATANRSWIVATNSTRENDLMLVSGGHARTMWTSNRPLASPALSRDGKHLVVGVTSTNSNAWLISSQ